MKIPRAIQLLNNANRFDTQLLLRAAILATEDEMLEIKDNHILTAEGQKLVTTVMEDGTVVLVCEPK